MGRIWESIPRVDLAAEGVAWKSRWQWHPGPRLVRWLVRIPAVLLAAAYGVALV